MLAATQKSLPKKSVTPVSVSARKAPSKAVHNYSAVFASAGVCKFAWQVVGKQSKAGPTSSVSFASCVAQRLSRLLAYFAIWTLLEFVHPSRLVWRLASAPCLFTSLVGSNLTIKGVQK